MKFLRKKPDPYRVGKYIPINRKISGQGYIWATIDNVDAIKKGNYSLLNPIAAEFDLSTQCIYRCPWCAYRESKKTNGIILQNNLIAVQIVNKLYNSGVRLLVLTGGGEPLLSDCVEIAICEARRLGMYVTLYTNGYLLNTIRSNKLLTANISEIRFSLNDISSQEGYKIAHGDENSDRLSVDNIMNNLIEFLKACDKSINKPQIGVSFVLAESSAKNLEQSLSILKSRLEKHRLSIDYTLIRPAINYWPKKRSDYKQYLPNTIDVLNKAKMAQIKFSKFKLLGEILISSRRFLDIRNEENGPQYAKCLAASTWMNIGPDATAYFCCETKHIPDFAIGNILNNNTDPINSEIAIKMRESLGSTSNCPTRLCKPSELNIIFNDIESHRDKSTGVLPKAINQWLDSMAKWAKTLSINISIPSVSGQYDFLT